MLVTKSLSDAKESLEDLIVGPISHYVRLKRSRGFVMPEGVPEGLEAFVRVDHELARANFGAVREFYANCRKDDRAFLSAAGYAVIGATGLGDVELFNQVLEDVRSYPSRYSHPQVETGLEVFKVWLHSWLRISNSESCDRILLTDPAVIPESWRQHFLCAVMHILVYKGEAMAAYAMAVAQLFDEDRIYGESGDGVWNKMMCALVCRNDMRREDERHWLERAVAGTKDSGYVLPFLGVALGAGSALDDILNEKAPGMYSIVKSHGHNFHRGRVRLRNAYTGETISEKLTPREFYAAQLLARGCRYKEIAKRMGITVGRAKNVILQIHEKLGVHKRGEISAHIWTPPPPHQGGKCPKDDQMIMISPID